MRFVSIPEAASAVLGPNFASHLLALVLGQASQMESCMRTSLVLVASFFIVVSSSASDARPSRPSVNVSECNVTMPCDFSGPQIRRGRIASYPREQHGFEQRVTSHRNAMAEVNDGRAQVVGGRPAGCPRSFCGRGASIRVFGHIVPGINSLPTGCVFLGLHQRPEWLPREAGTSSF